MLFGISLPIITGYILAILSLGIIYWLYFYKRHEVMPDLRGKDKTWQIIELASVIWLILLPMLVVCDLLGVEANTQVWASMDAIYFISVGGKMGMHYLTSKNAKNNLPADEPPIDETKKDEKTDGQ